MYRVIATAALFAVSAAIGVAQEPDAGRGAELAEACAACHGQQGVSVEPGIPNLAAQKEAYIVDQLEAFREGKRPSQIMKPIASALTDADMADLAAHFSGLPGAEPGATGEGLAGLDGGRVTFPVNFETRLARYHKIDFPDRKQVRHYWVQPDAAEAARAGQPLPSGTLILTEIYKARVGPDGEPIKGEDGHLAAGELSAYTAMQKIAGSGAQVPEIYANENWRYAVFEADRTRKATNEARCLACHKPESSKDYVFTYDRIGAMGQ